MNGWIINVQHEWGCSYFEETELHFWEQLANVAVASKFAQAVKNFKDCSARVDQYRMLMIHPWIQDVHSPPRTSERPIARLRVKTLI